MGSRRGASNERPAHKVEIQPFLIGASAVTLKQWDQAAPRKRPPEESSTSRVAKVVQKMTARLSRSALREEVLEDKRLYEDPRMPAHGLSFELIQKWLARRQEFLRLSSEAEWEFACRAGTESDFYWGETMDEAFCWHNANSQAHPHPADSLADRSNAFGLRNMLGNVLECVADDYHTDYQRTPRNGDAARDATSEWAVARGGSWFDSAHLCRSFTRRRILKSERAYFLGLRLAVDVSQWLTR